MSALLYAFASIRRLGGHAPVEFLEHLPRIEGIVVTKDDTALLFHKKVYVCALDPSISKVVFVSEANVLCPSDLADYFEHTGKVAASIADSPWMTRAFCAHKLAGGQANQA